jgi:hypothetical protein
MRHETASLIALSSKQHFFDGDYTPASGKSKYSFFARA